MRQIAALAIAFTILALMLSVPLICGNAAAAGVSATGTNISSVTPSSVTDGGTDVTLRVNAADGYHVTGISSVTMGGTLLTEGAGGDYTVNRGTVTVAGPVTGNIVITATAALSPIVTGRFVTGFDASGGKMVLAGVTVSLYDGANEPIALTTSSDGVFTMRVPPGTYSIDIRHPSYGLLADPKEIAGGNVTVTAAGIDFGDIAMAATFALVTGSVTYKGDPVSGISVVISDQSGRSLGSAGTDGGGRYSIECATGNNYTVTFSDPRFKTVTQGVGSLPAGPTEIPAQDLERRDVPTYMFDLDLTHTMMLIGGIMGLFMLFFVILYRIHINNHPDLSRIHSDSRKKKKDQE